MWGWLPPCLFDQVLLAQSVQLKRMMINPMEPWAAMCHSRRSSCALHLQGLILNSSDRGGIRIQYSKNPFGKKRDFDSSFANTTPVGSYAPPAYDPAAYGGAPGAQPGYGGAPYGAVPQGAPEVKADATGGPGHDLCDQCAAGCALTECKAHGRQALSALLLAVLCLCSEHLQHLHWWPLQIGRAPMVSAAMWLSVSVTSACMSRVSACR